MSNDDLLMLIIWLFKMMIDYDVHDKEMQISSLVVCNYTNLNRPILLRCENISPPGTNSNSMYKLELSYIKEKKTTFRYASQIKICLIHDQEN